MTGDWPNPLGDALPLEPSGLSTSVAEIARGAAERDSDLRAERWLLVREVVILLAIVMLVVAVRP